MPRNGKSRIADDFHELRHVDSVHAPEHNVIPGCTGFFQLKSQRVQNGLYCPRKSPG